MDRIVHVKDIDIEIVDEDEDILEVSGKAITYRFLSDKEREENNKKKKKGKGKKGKGKGKGKKGNKK